MSNCLYIAPTELKKYTALGVSMFEIQRDYLENGTLRSPRAIKHKLNTYSSENFLLESKIEKNLSIFSKRSAEKWLEDLSKTLGVEAKIISLQEASQFHTDKGMSYNNESAFFSEGKVYFIEGTLTPESVVHEFGHPLIKSLDESVKQSLIQELLNTPTGKELSSEVESLYSNFDANAKREEILVRALTLEALGLKDSSFMTNLLYAIKQLLRKLVGKKVDVAKMTSKTTMLDLATMLSKGTEASLNKELLISQDTIDYYKNLDNYYKKFEDVLNSKDSANVQQLIDKLFETASSQIKQLESNEFLSEFQSLLVDEYKRGNLDVLKSKLSDISMSDTSILEEISKTDENGLKLTQEKIRERLKSLTESLFTVDEILKDTVESLDALSSLDSKANCDMILNYKRFVSTWDSVIEAFNTNFEFISEKNELSDLAARMNKNLTSAKSKINTLQKEAVKQSLLNILSEPASIAKKQFEEDLAKKKNSTQVDRDTLYRSYHNMSEAEYKRMKELKAIPNKSYEQNSEYNYLFDQWLLGSELNEEKVDSLMDGKTGDASYANGMLESVSMSTDPAVASINLLLQKVNSLANARGVFQYSEMTQEINKHLEKVNGKFQSRGALGQELSHVDVRGRFDKTTREVEEIKEHVFLDKWRQYRFDLAVLEAKVKTTAEDYKKTNDPEAKKAFYKAQHDIQVWKNTYMNQKFDASYYEADLLLLKDDVGIEAKERLDDLYEQLEDLNESNENGSNDDLIKNLRHELVKVYSSYDELGDKKTGLDLEVAERLQEFRKAKANFTTQDEIPNAFQDAYLDQIAYLKEVLGLDETSQEFIQKKDQWLRQNTVVSVKSSLREKRAAALEEKAQLLKTLTEYNKQIFDTTELEKLISDSTSLLMDDGIQPNGFDSSKELREKILLAHKELEKHREQFVSKNGLTKLENKEFSALNAKFKNDGRVWLDPSDELAYKKLVAKKLEVKTALGIDAATEVRLKELDAILRNRSTIPTDYYKNQLISLLEKDNFTSKFLDYLEQEGYSYSTLEEVPNEDFQLFLNSELGKESLDSSSDLKEWVDQNHYENIDGKITPTNIWLTSMSDDPFDYKTKMLFNENGKKLGLIEIDGVFRIPSSEYFISVVKDKHTTSEVVGDTVDNRGRFLPKSEETNRYRNHAYYDLQKNDPDKFELLEALKKHYLKSQENADDKDKLYLALPKREKTRLENWRTGNVLKIGRRIREFTQGRADDALAYRSASSMLDDAKIQKGTVFEVFDVQAPVLGTFDIHFDDQSTDVIKNITEYAMSLKMKEALKEANSYSRLAQSQFNEITVDKRDFGNRRVIEKSYNNESSQTFKQSTKNNRSEIIKALVERELDGIQVTGRGADQRRLQKTVSALARQSSKMNFSWNLPSAFINAAQMKINSIVHAAAGDVLSPKYLALGEAWAMKTGIEISTNIRKRGEKGFNEQLMTLFDPIAGRSFETLGDTYSRTLIGDLLDGKMSTSARRWLELQGSLNIFGGLMHKTKVSVTDENGVTKVVPYYKAFVIKDGQIRTVPGIESGYKIDLDSDGKVVFGPDALALQKLAHNTAIKWNGAFAKQDNPLIARYTLAKLMLFLKKFYIPAIVKNLGFSVGTSKKDSLLPTVKKRMNWSTGVAEYGHQIAGLSVLKTTLLSGGRNIPHMTASERKGFAYLVATLAMSYVILPYVKGLVNFLYPDDDDREKVDYAKMRSRSGYYDGLKPITVDEDKYGFNTTGFLMNHLAHISTKANDEFNSVNLLHFTGVNEMSKMLGNQSVSLTQNVGVVREALLMIANEKSAEHSDTKGPFFYEQEGYENGKYIALLAKFGFGINHKNFAPTENLEQYVKTKAFGQ